MPALLNLSVLSTLLLTASLLAAPLLTAGEAVPDNGGPLTMITASLLGGDGEEQVTAVAVLGDGTVVAGGSCSAPFSVAGSKVSASGQGQGFLATFGADGRLRALAFIAQAVVAIQVGPRERLYVRDSGGQITLIDPLKGQTLGSLAVGPADRPQFAVDSDGAVVAITGKKLARFDASGKQLWAVSPPAHGDNRLRACTVDPSSGIAVVTGYGMTGTGHEPWKDPYAHAYDRSGTLLWSLWNNPPKEQADSKYGGTGLMADGTGQAVCATGDGGFMIMIAHDGGNAVTTRDPRDAFKPLDKAVFAGSFQDGPGWGMKGAIMTSVCFRVEGTKGTIEKGTWMCAWLKNHTQANTLRMENCVSDGAGTTYVVGASAGGLPMMKPWFSPRPDEYLGGGFLAAFDRGLALDQCGPFHPGSISAVAVNGGTIAIGGQAEGMHGKDKDKDRQPIAPAEQMRLVKPVGQNQVAGNSDAFIAIFHRAGVAKAAPFKAATAKAGKTDKASKTEKGDQADNAGKAP